MRAAENGMKKITRVQSIVGVLAVSALALNWMAQAAEEPIPTKIDFNRDIRPILSDKCYACHGPGRQSGTTPLNTRPSGLAPNGLRHRDHQFELSFLVVDGQGVAQEVA